jgi:hypothetical protein
MRPYKLPRPPGWANQPACRAGPPLENVSLPSKATRKATLQAAQGGGQPYRRPYRLPRPPGWASQPACKAGPPLENLNIPSKATL